MTQFPVISYRKDMVRMPGLKKEGECVCISGKMHG